MVFGNCMWNGRHRPEENLPWRFGRTKHFARWKFGGQSWWFRAKSSVVSLFRLCSKNGGNYNSRTIFKSEDNLWFLLFSLVVSVAFEMDVNWVTSRSWIFHSVGCLELRHNFMGNFQSRLSTLSEFGVEFCKLEKSFGRRKNGKTGLCNIINVKNTSLTPLCIFSVYALLFGQIFLFVH